MRARRPRIPECGCPRDIGGRYAAMSSGQDPRGQRARSLCRNVSERGHDIQPSESHASSWKALITPARECGSCKTAASHQRAGQETKVGLNVIPKRLRCRSKDHGLHEDGRDADAAGAVSDQSACAAITACTSSSDEDGVGEGLGAAFGRAAARAAEAAGRMRTGGVGGSVGGASAHCARFWRVP